MRLPRLPLVTALALLFFFAYITGIRLAYSLLYALILLFAVSYLWSRLAADNLDVERVSPEGQFEVGDEFVEQFTIHNRSWIPVPLIELTDDSNLPGYTAGRVFSLKGRRTRRWTSRGRFKQRGLFTFGPVELRYGDPFGLFPRTLRIAGTRSVVVYPVIRPHGGLPDRRRAAPGQCHRACHQRWAAERDRGGTRRPATEQALRILHAGSGGWYGLAGQSARLPETGMAASRRVDRHHPVQRRALGRGPPRPWRPRP